MAQRTNTAELSAEIHYPTGQYDREKNQHLFTMLMGVLLVVAGIGFAVFSFNAFTGDHQGVGTVVLLFAISCIVLGLGAAIPDGRIFFLKVLQQFRSGGRDVARPETQKPEEPTANQGNAAPTRQDEEAVGRSPANTPTAEHGLTGAPIADPIEPESLARQATAEQTPPVAGEPVPELVTAEDLPSDLGLAGWGHRKVRLEERWRLANTSDVRLRNHIGPVYLLDETYHFLDWNPVFDELIARELKLHRGMHAQFLINALSNRDAVILRAKQRFPEQAPPLVDLEPLVFESKRFGRIGFQKIASRILDDTGDTLLWIVTLNISDVQEKYAPSLWEAIYDKLLEAANWTAYANSYDKLLTDFDEYGTLVDTIVSRVGIAKRCIDLGAGTGNTTLKLLKDPDRLVWAVEDNDGMLLGLDKKIARLEQKEQDELAERLFISKANISSLGEFERGFFDAATMTNVLYAVDNPLDCLKEINRVLRIDGVLVLSTSTDQTDVDRLFDAMRRNLEDKDLFNDVATAWADAKAVHERMNDKIHRDSKEDIRSYLEKTGFRLDEDNWVDSTYAGAVVVAKAVKVREAF